MKRPFAAYEGDEPYVFVCYAHEDAGLVYPEIQRLHEGGIRIWYDEGVSPGSRWSDELARKLSAASLVLFFCTPRSVKSQHCQDELNFALDDKRPVLVVQDGAVDLPPGLRLRLNAHQSILKQELTADQFSDKLTAAISRHLEPGPRVAPIPNSRRRSRYVVGVAVVVVLATVIWRLWPSQNEVEQKPSLAPSAAVQMEYTVAVLPFRSLSSEPATVAFAEGVTDDLVNELSGPKVPKIRRMFPPQLYKLSVTPAASTLRYRNTTEDLLTISRALGAGYLVEGRVRAAGDRVRVAVQLVRAADNALAWSHSYDASIADPLQAQHDIAGDAAKNVAWMAPNMYRKSVNQAAFVSAEAADIWERANRAQMDGLMGGDVDISGMITSYEKTLELQPRQPWFYENLVGAYLTLMDASMEPVQTVAPIDELLTRATDILKREGSVTFIQPALFEAHMANYRLTQLDYANASRSLRAALSENPNGAYALFEQSVLLLHQERPVEALASNRRAIDDIATSPVWQLGLARLLRARGQSAAAVKAIDGALEFYPGDLGKVQLLLEQAQAYLLLGEADRAATLVDQAWVLAGSNHPDLFPASMATTGRSDRARAILRDLEAAGHGRRFNPLDVIEGYVALGDFDAAFRWIDRAIDAPFEPVVRWMHLVTISTAGIWPTALTSDPRWQLAYARLPKVDAI